MDTLPLSPIAAHLTAAGLVAFCLSICLLGICLGAAWFYAYAIYAAIDYLTHADAAAPEFHPKLTILKPLCGADSETYNNLLSFCQQNYPCYQIVFAVRDPADPCIALVQKLIQQFPDRDIELVISSQTVGINPKVNNLANAATAAKHALWVIADSDIRVGTDYLQQIVSPFRYPGVGVVTCPYRSQAHGWAATLTALGTAAEFHPGVLVARHLRGVHFALGSTIAIRQTVLAQLGGFAAIADYLADDYQLGKLPATIGYRVVLSRYVVEHRLAATSAWSALQQQIRWARGIRVSQPGGYLGKGITYGTVASLLLVLLGSGLGFGLPASGVLGLLWLLRCVMGWAVGVVCLNDSTVRRYWWLLPLYDLYSFAIWCSGLLGNSVVWHDQRFRLMAEGKLQVVCDRRRSNLSTLDSLPTLEVPILDRLPTLEEPALKKI